jgi:hypothetical protein
MSVNNLKTEFQEKARRWPERKAGTNVWIVYNIEPLM